MHAQGVISAKYPTPTIVVLEYSNLRPGLKEKSCFTWSDSSLSCNWTRPPSIRAILCLPILKARDRFPAIYPDLLVESITQPCPNIQKSGKRRLSVCVALLFHPCFWLPPGGYSAATRSSTPWRSHKGCHCPVFTAVQFPFFSSHFHLLPI